MANIAGKSGDVYIATLLLEDCEDAWESGANGTAALNTDRTYIAVGDGSSKCTIGAGISAGDVIMFETMAEAKDISTFSHILCWAYSVPTTLAADYRIGIGTTASGASPTTLVDLPALTANTLTYCHCTEVTGSEMADTSAGTIIGLESHANGANADVIYIDEVRAAKIIAGINAWSLDYTQDALETTDFQSAGIKSYIAGGSGWSGTFSGYKDGAPLSIGSLYGVEFAESSTATQMWLGEAIITGVHPSISYDGVVAYSYDFQGSGALRIASA
uniref:Putative tail protein n=1 Tax=viral metagenome TaxID=1070528 RepID=A0A6M3JWI0_9ZZZZ